MERNFSTNITELYFSTYKFQIYYFEKLNQNIPEFPHDHDMFEIYYMLDGAATFEINNKWHVVHAGECVFIDRNVTHHVCYDPSMKKSYFAIIFDFEDNKNDSVKAANGNVEYEDIKNELKRIHEMEYVISGDNNLDSTIIDELLTERIQKQLGWNTQVSFLAYRFVMKALRNLVSRPILDVEAAGQKNLAMEITMYIHKHYMEEITIEDVARELNTSIRHLNREYKNTFGITFMKNLNRIRMEYAKDYICNTTESIESIVEKVGLSSTTTLYNMFREFEGMSVSQYRDKIKANAKRELQNK